MQQPSLPPRSLLRIVVATLALAVGAAVMIPVVRAGDDAAAGDTSAAPKARFPREWFWASEEKDWKAIQKSVGSAAKPLAVKNWHGDAQDLAALRGRIVLIDFWATWCAPCKALIPAVNGIAAKYQDKGIVVFGVCNSQGANQMVAIAEKHGMKYPTAADAGRRTESAYSVRWWPFFVLIDREGIVRAAGLHPDHLSDAIDALLKEQPPG